MWNDEKFGKLPDVAIESIGGSCPIQADGSWRGRELYFRGRHEFWRLEVGDRGAVYFAGSSRVNAGWMSLAESAERIRLHLWAWNAKELGQEDSSAQGRLFKSIRLLDCDAARAAIFEGADVNASLVEGGASPLCCALGLSCFEAKSAVDDRSEAAFYNQMAGVDDDGRDAARLATVKVLLAAGADPAATPSGWQLAPVHWAATIPSGQQIGMGRDMSADSEKTEQAYARNAKMECFRVARHPMGALLEAGADLRQKFDMAEDCSNPQMASAVDILAESESWSLLEHLKPWLSVQEEQKVFRSLARKAESAKVFEEAAAFRMSSWVEGPAALRILANIQKGVWPLEWIAEFAGEFACSEKLLALAISRQEKHEMEQAIQFPELSSKRPRI